jgi:hypothetical protein
MSAAKNGFQFEHYPERYDQGESFAQDDVELQQASQPFINADGYGVGDQAPGFDRIPQPDDPHREVPRFADGLPEKLYKARFQRKLEKRFPHGDFEAAQVQYLSVLLYVYTKMRKWRTKAMSNQNQGQEKR